MPKKKERGSAGVIKKYLITASDGKDWARRLDGFLEFNGNELLIGPGKIRAEQAKLHAETEYEKYRIIQDRLYESDFDRFILETKGYTEGEE